VVTLRNCSPQRARGPTFPPSAPNRQYPSYILNEKRQSAPIGDPGEIYIGVQARSWFPSSPRRQLQTGSYPAPLVPKGGHVFSGQATSVVIYRMANRIFSAEYEQSRFEASGSNRRNRKSAERTSRVRTAHSLTVKSNPRQTLVAISCPPRRHNRRTRSCAISCSSPAGIHGSAIFVKLEALLWNPNGKVESRRTPAPNADNTLRDKHFRCTTNTR